MKAGRVGANLATLANASLGVGSIAYTLAGNKLWAMLLIAGAIAFDGLDGLLSRRGGLPSGRFGRVADSLADAISFAVAPGFLLTIHTDSAQLWSSFTGEAFLAAAAVTGLGLARLVYFTLRGYLRPYFVGASTPQTALGVVLTVLLFDLPGYLGVHPIVVVLVTPLLALLMVLPIPYPKMRRGERFRWPMTLTAMAAAVALVPIQFRPAPGTLPYAVGEWATALFGVGLASYYLGGPFSVRHYEARSSREGKPTDRGGNHP
ncbi:MAG TPA: CDP-alcohol phosphatidyltransferase family protein [Thermoplasmata archaeon]|nr:CDP-alcohol phosphatidyltransferase family protein [Thermoplasmata archaeon]